MVKRNRFLEQLEQRREQASAPTPVQPETPEPSVAEAAESLPDDPAARAALLGDEVRDLRERLAGERQARQQAERRASLEAQKQPRSLAEVLHAASKRHGKGRTWR